MARIRFTNNAVAEPVPPLGQLSLYSKTDLGVYIQGDDGFEKRLIDTSCPGAAGYIVEQFSLGIGEILSKEITLTDPPTYADRVLLQIDGAALSFYGVDFTVSGNTVSWNGLRLDGLLEVGDLVQVIYFV